MSESPDARTRRRWINFGELIAVAALAVSAAGVWVSWNGKSDKAGPARVIEQKQSIALVLRGRVEADGKRMQISPLEDSHALESLRISVPGGKAEIELGSDGELNAGDLDGTLRVRDKELKGSHSVPLRIEARYVELGAERKATGMYHLRYRWDGGGLFGGHSVRLTGLSRG